MNTEKGENKNMAKILSTEELREILHFVYESQEVAIAREKRRENIQAFFEINRDGLEYGKKERNMLLYTTIENEKIFIQYPGLESIEKNPKPKDFRPKLMMVDGTYMSDITFGRIWDVLDEIGKRQNAILSCVAAIFLRMGYLHGYVKKRDVCECNELEIKEGEIYQERSIGVEELEWYKLDFSDDFWFSMNDRIGKIEIDEGKKISFEGFIKYVDLLFQNEDCKYYYINTVVKGMQNYNLKNGRTNTSAANLLILKYLQGYEKLSVLLNAFQKSRGVPSMRKADYRLVTNEIVECFSKQNR